MQGSPLLRAVAKSTSLSPTYTGEGARRWIQVVVVFGIGERTDLIGAPATIGLQANVTETLEELLPSRLHTMGERIFQTIGITDGGVIVAIAAEAGDLKVIGC